MMVKPSHLTLVALRHSTRHPIQSLLLILGVALGVAMIIAIDLANSSAGEAFALSTDSIAGRATHQIVAAPGDVPTGLYRKLRTRLGLRNIAPIVAGTVKLVEAEDLPLQLLGVDPFAEAPFRSYMSGNSTSDQTGGILPVEVLTSLLLEPNTVLLSEKLGQQLGLQPGDRFTIRVNGRVLTVRLAGLLRPSDDLSRRALNRLALADISTAQELLGKEGILSHIDLLLTADSEADAIRSELPDTVQLRRANLRNETLDQLTQAFALNLTALSLLGVVVGMFLIYNTISFSVVQRRPILGMLRCLGVTRREIFGLVLTEALILSAIGTLIGLGLGILLGRGLVGLVTQTINDLFFSVTVQSVSLQPFTLYKGVAAGLGAGLIAASIPALEATTIPPISTLKRSTAESRMQAVIPWVSLAGGILNILGAILLYLPTDSLVVSFSALFLIIIGLALLTPLLTRLLLALIAWSTQWYPGIIRLMALRDISRALSRTSVTIAALMVAVSVIIGVSVMIASFRNTVIDWLDTILRADIFISSVDNTGSVDAQLISQLAEVTDVTSLELARITTLFSPDLGPVQVNAFSDGVAAGGDLFWANGSLVEAAAALQKGDIFVSEVFARQHQLPLNRPSEITLNTKLGPHPFQVSGIFYNYSPRGFILMQLETYRHHWQDDTVTNVAVYIKPEVDSDRLAETLQIQYSGQYQVNIASNRGVKQSAIVVFDRTFTITAALRLLATLVAFIGVLSALMSLQLERSKELGTLRANGMTINQLWQMTLLETGIMGTIAGLIAIPSGLIMAAILIYVINLRSFGWSLRMELAPQLFILAMVVAITAALIAGIYPALRLGKLEIASALREE